MNDCCVDLIEYVNKSSSTSKFQSMSDERIEVYIKGAVKKTVRMRLWKWSKRNEYWAKMVEEHRGSIPTPCNLVTLAKARELISCHEKMGPVQQEVFFSMIEGTSSVRIRVKLGISRYEEDKLKQEIRTICNDNYEREDESVFANAL